MKLKTLATVIQYAKRNAYSKLSNAYSVNNLETIDVTPETLDSQSRNTGSTWKHWVHPRNIGPLTETLVSNVQILGLSLEALVPAL